MDHLRSIYRNASTHPLTYLLHVSARLIHRADTIFVSVSLPGRIVGEDAKEQLRPLSNKVRQFVRGCEVNYTLAVHRHCSDIGNSQESVVRHCDSDKCVNGVDHAFFDEGPHAVGDGIGQAVKRIDAV